MAKILVIDDDRGVIILLQRCLEEKGFEVVTAPDGQEGLKKVRQENPDLIILDVEMPRMNGYTFMNALKKLSDFKYIPVIVLTAYDEMQPIFTLKGVRGYLVKPLVPEQLFKKMGEILDTH